VQAGVSLGDLAMRAIDLGAPIIIAGAIQDHVSLRLVGGAGVTSIAQLAGQRVSAGAVEGGTANLLRYELKRAGVDPRGVLMISITASSDRLVALGNGQVKGALMTAPFDALAVQQGMKILDVFQSPYLLTPLIVNTVWANKNPELASKLLQSMREGAAWIHDPQNRAEAIQILADYTKTDPAVCVDAYEFLILKQRSISPTMEVPAASLENILLVDREVGSVPGTEQPFELGRYYDPRFLKGE
jgi:ABC-type nitrate/sulfonate/bicarbonate transport system substrate-binding protein